MAGTKEGGRKAAITNFKKHGIDFYRNIGRKGGSKCGVLKGFALDPERARLAGAKGGKVSKRGKAKDR